MKNYLSQFDYAERKNMKITSEELVKLLQEDKAQLIDIRFREEFAAWNMGIARNIPLPELPERLHEIDRDKLVVTACPHKDRAILGRIFLTLNGSGQISGRWFNGHGRLSARRQGQAVCRKNRVGRYLKMSKKQRGKQAPGETSFNCKRMKSFYAWDDDVLVLNILGTPSAKRDVIGKPKGKQLKISVTATPVAGKATDHMVRFLAKEFGVS